MSADFTVVALRHQSLISSELARRAEPVFAGFGRCSWANDTTVDITADGVTKATTVERLLAQYDIGPREVVAFGDMPNDVPMLAWAGRAYAVANAHPDVIAIATAITKSNDEDGVALALSELLG